MTDIQHPTTGDVDMNALQSVFQSAANAIVRASELGKEVGLLREQVSTLTHDVNNLRSSNDALVRELQELRTERADLQSKLRDAEWARDSYRADHDREVTAHEMTKMTYDADMAQATADCDALKARWQNAIEERDDAEMEILQLKEKLRKAEGTIASIREALGPPTAPEVEEATPPKTPTFTSTSAPAVETLPGAAPWREYEPGDVWNSESRKWEKQIRHPDGTFGEKLPEASGY